MERRSVPAAKAVLAAARKLGATWEVSARWSAQLSCQPRVPRHWRAVRAFFAGGGLQCALKSVSEGGRHCPHLCNTRDTRRRDGAAAASAWQRM